MLSDLTATLSRWVIISVVQSSAWMDSTMMSSTSVSSSDVDSSSTRMSGSAIHARASAMSWRCAAVRLCPSSSTTCSKPPGRTDSRSQAPTARIAASTSSAVASGLRVADVRRDGALEHERVLRHDAEPRAEAVELEVAEVDAVDQHAAGVGIVGAAEELGDARLAGAGVADQGRDLAGLHRERHVAEHGPGRLGVGERDRLEGDGPVEGRAHAGVDALLGQDRLVERLAQAAPRHAHVEELVVERPERLERAGGRRWRGVAPSPRCRCSASGPTPACPPGRARARWSSCP